MFIISCFHSTPHCGDNFLGPPPKRNQELKDIGIITTSKLPLWIPELAQSCTFLFPIKTRKLLFYIKTFDRESSLQKLKNGHGVGPTKEFFVKSFREIQRFHLKLWRGEVNSGLEDATVHYKVLAKCVIDSRQRPIVQNSTLITSVPRENIFRGLREELEDLDLDFTLTRSLVLKLKNNGTTEPFSLSNLCNYIELFSYLILVGGVNVAMHALEAGFESNINSRFSNTSPHHFCYTALIYSVSLQVYQIEKECEIENVVDSWDSSPSPRPAQVMAEIVSTYDSNERKKFLQFLTGDTLAFRGRL
ncbi:hypothetical protein DAPPUDRAFT_330943 [Daphnia pulex]|uniref:E3 ubiquitin-protein ligase n=1 Tax=Daphnia pulex TaxID=6669 RepID=E9HL26_DAPPU|nr:hypothetical protein DAPPUDRAFT_330943 [Daphnia pulex]|eukprot:EFX67558.1 hypothetical protein DAPPUDRAFT_330943 [Daphnia pulex]